jgi:hypothetical protein
MENIENYKTRFYTLMESTMGDVKPLISEAPQYEEFITPTREMLLDCFVDSKKTGALNKITISMSGNEYKMTLPEGMYEANELIIVMFSIDKSLLLESFGDINSDKGGCFYSTYYNSNLVGWIRNMPSTQKEFDENSPYIQYLDVPCKNVRGGKIRFSIEVPSGSEIFETETP